MPVPTRLIRLGACGRRFTLAQRLVNLLSLNLDSRTLNDLAGMHA